MAYFAEKNYFEDQELIELTERVMSGDLTLTWWDAKTERVRAQIRDPRRGLTYADCNLGTYGWDEIPEFVRDKYNMAARGSEIWGKLPDLGYTLNRKSDVWAENVAELYEESKARRWAPAVDLDWTTLPSATTSPELEAATAQLCTTLEEIALVAMEMPSRWIFSINQEFLELKSHLCAQMIDEARHVEVFRKRALAGGQGLKRASASIEQALKEILFAETYPEGSFALNVMLATLIANVLAHAAATARLPIDTRLFRLCLQDTGRELAYGMGQARYHFAHQPHARAVFEDYLDRSEHCLFGVAGSPELLEPLIVLSGGGTAKPQIAHGCRVVARLMAKTVEEYFERCDALGLSERRRRSRLPARVAATAA
ncbi:MAG: hypothetical protein HY271_07050 [Deltaproteobacteria bacterium]|nr:hypothetical protein [Deltaproteobacteria bacterium]